MIEKILSRLKSVLVKKPRYIKTHDNPLEIAIDTFKSIDSLRYGDIFSSSLSAKQLNSICVNIHEYIELLEKILHAFKYEETLYILSLNPKGTKHEVKNIYLRDFYIHNGYYLDPVEETARYIALCIQYLSMYNNLERKPLSFELEHNMRITTYVVNNLIAISKEISL